MTAAMILGCSGPVLTEAEAVLFAEAKPWGFILFRRNVESPDQVRTLTAALRASVARDDAPVFVDQEGGRVQRLGPPHWRKYPPAQAYARAANDPFEVQGLARLGGRLLAHDLAAVGITADCAPVLDVPVRGAHDIIGDRAFADGPDEVARLGRAMAEGLLAGGVLPVVKHLPGHGRAFADSHHELPVVNADLAALDEWDFAPFRRLSDMPMAMTAHVVFTAIDPKRPATVSKKAVRLIRDRLGFEGLLMTDDLSMQALSGTIGERAHDAIRAGCDVVLHCNGKLDEMRQVADAAPKLKGKAKRRAEAALARIVRAPEPLDVAEAHDRLDRALTGRLEAKAGPPAGEA